MKSVAGEEYITSGTVRDIALQIADKDVAGKVKAAGVDMVKYASANLINGREDGDDWCPPYPPFPRFGHDQFTFGPRPEPWLPQSLAELNPQPLSPRVLASALKVIAKYTSLAEVSKQLNDSAARLGQVRG